MYDCMRTCICIPPTPCLEIVSVCVCTRTRCLEKSVCMCAHTPCLEKKRVCVRAHTLFRKKFVCLSIHTPCLEKSVRLCVCPYSV